ncbi:hypothetical protein N9009_00675 [bacterium]|nr:hypothetical protein [bacterium]
MRRKSPKVPRLNESPSRVAAGGTKESQNVKRRQRKLNSPLADNAECEVNR